MCDTPGVLIAEAVFVLAGDFAQLAPVPQVVQKTVQGKAKNKLDPARYAFENAVWKLSNFNCFKLTHNWRQDQGAGDNRLLRLLERLRLASSLQQSSLEDIQALMQDTNVDVDDPDTVVVTCLRRDARMWSEKKLNGPSMVLKEKLHFYGVDRHGVHRYVNNDSNLVDADVEEDDEAKVLYDENNRRKNLFSSISSQAVVQLRVGAKVVSTQKIGSDIMVGTRGVVVGFRAASEYVQDDLNKPVGGTMDFGKSDWQYVQHDRRWPLVRFEVNGDSVLKTVHPQMDTLEDSLGVLLCSRVQLPSVLGYAMTVHRAQGQTLGKVAFMISGVFSYGQIYSALSRVRYFKDLKVMGSLAKKKWLASPSVIEFERSVKWTFIEND